MNNILAANRIIKNVSDIGNINVLQICRVLTDCQAEENKTENPNFAFAELLWNELKNEACSNPKTAVRIIVLNKNDFLASIARSLKNKTVMSDL